MNATTKYAKAMEKMRQQGEVDFLQGFPITSFPDRDHRSGPAAMFGDRARAAYECGWRAAKEDFLRQQAEVKQTESVGGETGHNQTGGAAVNLPK